METETAVFYPWWFDFLFLYLRYFLLAGAAYLVLYVWRHRAIASLKIQTREPSGKIIRSEILYSMSTLTIYCAISFLLFKSYFAGITRIYPDLHQFGYLYFGFSILFMIVLHDAWFYWTHRLIHHPRLFSILHWQHHRSHAPTPWASFSFHPLEALLSGLYVPMIVFLFPVHPFAVFAFLTFMTLINVMGHSGFELFPKRYRSSLIGRMQNCATNHDLHHETGRYNYGLYFTFWDRLMGTYKAVGRSSGRDSADKVIFLTSDQIRTNKVQSND